MFFSNKRPRPIWIVTLRVRNNFYLEIRDGGARVRSTHETSVTGIKNFYVLPKICWPIIIVALKTKLA